MSRNNIHEAQTHEEKLRFIQGVATSRSWKERLQQNKSGLLLILVMATAALALTLLHLKGRSIMQYIRATPLPVFSWEKELEDKPLPEKTAVYEQALKEEAKEKRQQASVIYRPDWKNTQAAYSERKEEDDSMTPAFRQADTLMQMAGHQDTLASKTDKSDKPGMAQRRSGSSRKRTKPSKLQTQDKLQEPERAKEASPDFFQPVKAGMRETEQAFTACVVHGDQQLSNNSLLALRLTQPLYWPGSSFPAGTIVYGTARLMQNRILVSISRIAQFPVALQVHHHTFHEGILLDETLNVGQEATRQTAFRQGQRSLPQLPFEVATEMGRNLLQAERRKSSRVFLPDGFPLYLSKVEN